MTTPNHSSPLRPKNGKNVIGDPDSNNIKEMDFLKNIENAFTRQVEDYKRRLKAEGVSDEILEKVFGTNSKPEHIKFDKFKLMLNYSPKSHAFFGPLQDHPEIRDKLKATGCKFNSQLHVGNDRASGWIMSVKAFDKVKKALRGVKYQTVTKEELSASVPTVSAEESEDVGRLAPSNTRKTSPKEEPAKEIEEESEESESIPTPKKVSKQKTASKKKEEESEESESSKTTKVKEIEESEESEPKKKPKEVEEPEPIKLKRNSNSNKVYDGIVFIQVKVKDEEVNVAIGTQISSDKKGLTSVKKLSKSDIKKCVENKWTILSSDHVSLVKDTKPKRAKKLEKLVPVVEQEASYSYESESES